MTCIATFTPECNLRSFGIGNSNVSIEFQNPLVVSVALGHTKFIPTHQNHHLRTDSETNVNER
jgi:hypothetical protein